MKNLSKKAIVTFFLPALLAAAIAGQAFGQTMEADLADVQAVNELKTEDGTLDRSSDTKSERPIGRAVFVKHVTVSLNGSAVNVVAMQIPVGKRLVIEKVSAVVRSPESQRVEVDYFTYANNGGIADRSIHQLVLEKQASFKDSAVFTANQTDVVFADERIGGEHFSVGISARLSGAADQFAQAQFTFSGYLEDLPAN